MSFVSPSFGSDLALFCMALANASTSETATENYQTSGCGHYQVDKLPDLRLRPPPGRQPLAHHKPRAGPGQHWESVLTTFVGSLYSFCRKAELAHERAKLSRGQGRTEHTQGLQQRADMQSWVPRAADSPMLKVPGAESAMDTLPAGTGARLTCSGSRLQSGAETPQRAGRAAGAPERLHWQGWEP